MLVEAVMELITYERAELSDLPAVRQLLGECGLPTDDVETLLPQFILARMDSHPIGVVAVQGFGASALLRSLAVAPVYRGAGVGRALLTRILTSARLLGAAHIFLLTTEAEGFFVKLGFERVERSLVPASIRASALFHSDCCQTAACMARDIRDQSLHVPADLLQLRADTSGVRMWAVPLERTMLAYSEIDSHCRFEVSAQESERVTLVLAGELYFEVHGLTYQVRSGEVMTIPAGVPYAFWTESLLVRAIDARSPVIKEALGGRVGPV